MGCREVGEGIVQSEHTPFLSDCAKFSSIEMPPSVQTVVSYYHMHYLL